MHTNPYVLEQLVTDRHARLLVDARAGRRHRRARSSPPGVRTVWTVDDPVVAARIRAIAAPLVEATDLRAGWRVTDVTTSGGIAATATSNPAELVRDADVLRDGRSIAVPATYPQTVGRRT